MRNKYGSIAPLFLILFCLFTATLAHALDIPVSTDFARQGDRLLAKISLQIPEGYHAYAHEPGEGGKPTNLKFILENTGAVPALYPPGREEPDIFDPAIKVHVYYGNVNILAILPQYSAGKLYAGEIDLLLCSNRHCLPVKQNFNGHVPAKSPLLSDVSWQEEAKQLLARQADSSGAISLEEGAPPPPIPEKSEAAVSENAQAGEKQLSKASPISEAEAYDFGFTPRFSAANIEVYSLGKALLLGLLAGLILNAMPCVLPVLTLKLSGLLLVGDLENRAKLKEFRTHNLCFAAGIMTLFTVLALILGLADMMWGQLYQNQLILLLMLLLVFLMGLSMLGVFTLPAFDLRIGQSCKNPALSSYLAGLISTFLATPCSGPLLGGVLAWAFLQPLPVLMAVFWSVGAGMGLPYLAFSLWPRLSHLLPRPGAWMQVFERLLGFLLLGTALYILSILPEHKYLQILTILLLASMAAWFWGAYCDSTAPPLRRKIGGAASLAALGIAMFWILQPAPPASAWQPFTAETFSRQLGRKPMFVEFTADWCPNCKFLEASVLDNRNMAAWQKAYGFELVKVDLTNANPYAEKLLHQLGSRSIPLTALFPEGQLAKSPVVLRDLYTNGSLKKALELAFAPGSRLTVPDQPANGS